MMSSSSSRVLPPAFQVTNSLQPSPSQGLSSMSTCQPKGIEMAKISQPVWCFQWDGLSAGSYASRRLDWCFLCSQETSPPSCLTELPILICTTKGGVCLWFATQILRGSAGAWTRGNGPKTRTSAVMRHIFLCRSRFPLGCNSWY